MKARYCLRLLALAMLFGIVAGGAPAYSQLTDAIATKKYVKEGKVTIPGFPEDTIKFTITQQKPPNPMNDPTIDKQLQYWFDVTLCRKDTAATSDISFVICTMLNVNQPKKPSKKVRAKLEDSTWKCEDAGTETWYPNFHLGCKQITMNTNGQMAQMFDTTITFPNPFTEGEIAATYTDIAKACPKGFDTSCNLVGPDIFLIPGTNIRPGNPDGTSSFWIQNEGTYDTVNGRGTVVTDTVITRDTIVDEMLFPTGNLYTMGFMDQNYEGMLVGHLVNAPLGARFTLRFPPSTGGGTHRFIVESDTTRVAVPFVITHDLMNDLDEHTYVTVEYPITKRYPDSSRSMEFEADVIAANTTYFPDGTTIFKPGDWMHGVLLQWVRDNDLPYVTSETIEHAPGDPESYQLRVSAVDAGTMPTSALFRFRVDGVRQPDRVISFDDPAMVGDTVHFVAQLGRIPDGARIDSCEIYVRDLAGHQSLTRVPDLIIADAPLVPALSGFWLGAARPNPFGAQTRIDFAIPARARVLLELYDAAGRRAATLVDETREAGYYTTTVDAAGLGLAEGIYYYRLQAGTVAQSRSFVIVK